MNIETIFHNTENTAKIELIKAGKEAEGWLRWFDTSHLPAHLAAIVEDFGRLAAGLASVYPPSAELTTAIRQLVQAKDSAVRAAVLFKEAEPK